MTKLKFTKQFLDLFRIQLNNFYLNSKSKIVAVASRRNNSVVECLLKYKFKNDADRNHYMNDIDEENKYTNNLISKFFSDIDKLSKQNNEFLDTCYDKIFVIDKHPLDVTLDLVNNKIIVEERKEFFGPLIQHSRIIDFIYMFNEITIAPYNRTINLSFDLEFVPGISTFEEIKN